MLKTTLYGTHDHVSILYGYTVRAPKRFIKELKNIMRNQRSPLTNWKTWKLCEDVYTESGVWQVSMIDHNNKIIEFAHHFFKILTAQQEQAIHTGFDFPFGHLPQKRLEIRKKLIDKL